MKKLVFVLIILVIFLGWKAYGGANLFKNTPKDVTENYLKGLIENNFDLFMKSQSQQDLEQYAKSRNLTVDQVKEETKLLLNKSYKSLQGTNIKLSDFKISQPSDYKSRDSVWVSVEYTGNNRDVDKNINVPVHREYDGNWYITQDENLGNMGSKSNVKSTDSAGNKNIGKIDTDTGHLPDGINPNKNKKIDDK